MLVIKDIGIKISTFIRNLIEPKENLLHEKFVISMID